jgi:hypothetical protein
MPEELAEAQSLKYVWNDPALQQWPLGPFGVDFNELGPGPHTAVQKAACFRTFRLDWQGHFLASVSDQEAESLRRGEALPESLLKRGREILDERIIENAERYGKPFIGYSEDYTGRIADWLVSEPDGGAEKLARLSKALDRKNRVRAGKAKEKIWPESRDYYYAALEELRLFLKCARTFIRQRDSLQGWMEDFRKYWPCCKGEILKHQGYKCLQTNLAHLEDFLAAKAEEGLFYHYLRDVSAEQFLKEWMPFGSGQSEGYMAWRISTQGRKRRKGL